MLFELDIESLQNLQRNISNNFWKDVIGAWIDYKNEFNENIDPRTYPIWDSYFLTNKNLIIRSHKFQNKGIT